jgi:hypothetical protein
MFGGRRATLVLLSTLALFVASARAGATPMVLYSVTDLGGGLFQYDLTVDNDGGGEDLAGLNILYGDSVFGLDGSSIIGAPPGWLYFAPLPPLIDDLNYFSLDPGADVPIDGTLAGFFFQSSTDPNTLSGDDFAVEGIGADSATQIDLGIAKRVPEPGALLLLAAGGAVLTSGRGRRLRR